MKPSVFTYSILRYIDSQLTGEVVNVGILLMFPEKNTIIFRHPSNLSRIKSLFRNFSEWLLKHQLRSFQKISYDITQNWELGVSQAILENPNKFIEDVFLISDSTSLQFDSAKAGVLYTSDVEKLADDYYDLYFANYETNYEVKRRHDSQYIIKKFKTLIQAKSLEVSKYIIDQPFEVKSDKTALQFEMRWQNGTTNLIKPISFDLIEPEAINSKAILFAGRFNYLSEVAREKGYKFDILLSKPQDPSLNPAYQNAVEILKDIDAPKEIIMERDMEAYSEKAIKTVKRTIAA